MNTHIMLQLRHNDFLQYTKTLMTQHHYPCEQGWFTFAQHHHSPNFSKRPSHTQPYLIVIHNISLPPFQYHTDTIIRLFTNQLAPDDPNDFIQDIAHLKVSSHFLISRQGITHQFVSCNDMAYHAGISSFQGKTHCNQFSIGIELEGCDFEPFTEPQYQTLHQLITSISQHYPITHICGHTHIAPNRKTDPGHFFDWHRLHFDNIHIITTPQNT